MTIWYLTGYQEHTTGKAFSLQQMVSGKTGFPYAKDWDGIFILLYTQNQLKGIKNVNIRPDIVKILEDFTGKLYDIGLGNDVLDITPKAHE